MLLFSPKYLNPKDVPVKQTARVPASRSKVGSLLMVFTSDTYCFTPLVGSRRSFIPPWAET